jgi:hypothetical protein
MVAVARSPQQQENSPENPRKTRIGADLPALVAIIGPSRG